MGGISKHFKGKLLATPLALLSLALGVSACGESLDSNGSAPATTSTTSSKSLPLNEYRLQTGKRVVLVSGKQIPIQQKAVTGYVDNTIQEDKMLGLSGWAASASLSQPADAIVAFVGKKPVAALKPAGERPDVVEGYGKPGLERSGFLLSIPAQSLDCSAPQQGLTVLGIAGGKASPLVWLTDTRQRVGDSCESSATSR